MAAGERVPPTLMFSLLERYGREALNRILMLFRPDEPTVRKVSYRNREFLVSVNEDVGWRMTSTVRFEHAEFEVLRERIQPDFTCIDVGANIGVHTVLLSDMVARGDVFAFEPDRWAYHLLNLNLLLNSAENVLAFENPISDREEVMPFHESVDSGFSAVEPTGRRDIRGRIDREALTLDGFTERRDVEPDFVKIDVEGHEPAVLRGMRGLLSDKSRRPSYLLVEIDTRHISAADQGGGKLLSFLRERGYRARSIGPSGLEEGFDPNPVVQNVLFTAE